MSRQDAKTPRVEKQLPKQRIQPAIASVLQPDCVRDAFIEEVEIKNLSVLCVLRGDGFAFLCAFAPLRDTGFSPVVSVAKTQ